MHYVSRPNVKKLDPAVLTRLGEVKSVFRATGHERAHLGWAEADERVVAITRRAVAAAEAAGASALPAAVRDHVEAALLAWDGQAVPLGKDSLHLSRGRVSPAEAELVEFSLILAIAPERLTEAQKASLARAIGCDEDRIKAVIWITFRAAMHNARMTGGAGQMHQSAGSRSFVNYHGKEESRCTPS